MPKTLTGLSATLKSGYLTDKATGKRTDTIDNELIDSVVAFTENKPSSCRFSVSAEEVFKKGVIVPAYFNKRFNTSVEATLKKLGVPGVSLGELIDSGTLAVRQGHGSPGNDQRTGKSPTSRFPTFAPCE